MNVSIRVSLETANLLATLKQTDKDLIHPLIFSDVFSISYERPIKFTAVQPSVVALTALGCRPTSIGYGRYRRVAAGYSKVD